MCLHLSYPRSAFALLRHTSTLITSTPQGTSRSRFEGNTIWVHNVILECSFNWCLAFRLQLWTRNTPSVTAAAHWSFSHITVYSCRLHIRIRKRHFSRIHSRLARVPTLYAHTPQLTNISLSDSPSCVSPLSALCGASAVLSCNEPTFGFFIFTPLNHSYLMPLTLTSICQQRHSHGPHSQCNYRWSPTPMQWLDRRHFVMNWLNSNIPAHVELSSVLNVYHDTSSHFWGVFFFYITFSASFPFPWWNDWPSTWDLPSLSF